MCLGLLLVATPLVTFQAGAAVVPELNQDATPYNFGSQRGVPISTVLNVPPGSSGLGPTLSQQLEIGETTDPPQAGQFQSLVSFGAVAIPPVEQRENLNPSASFVANAVATGLPLGMHNGAVTVVMSSARVGAPFVAQRVTILFGSVIDPPSTDVDTNLLSGVVPQAYWLPEPFTTNGHATASYYYSPHARQVFAVQAGPLSVTWKKAVPSSSVPADFGANPARYSLENGNYYTLFTTRHIVSGSPVKKPQKLYWTEGVFTPTGKPVTVPAARVGAVQVVYNNNFPARVAHEYRALGQSSPVPPGTPVFEETRTLWYDQLTGQIKAYNQEGRVFMELLGDSRPDGVTRSFLGFEIVDVIRQPNPADVVINLGEPLTPFANPALGDAGLIPSPLAASAEGGFVLSLLQEGSTRPTLYATRATANLNDLNVHWLVEGQQGLLWPDLLVRYALVWPTSPAAYSHYVRPLVGSEQEAQTTAIALPQLNQPTLDYQDPLDQPRGKLTPQSAYYSYLTPAYPAHRALLRYTSGDDVFFERVFSWLDQSLVTTNFAGSVATNLSHWNPATLGFNAAPAGTVPRVIEQTVTVGDRLAPPSGELGSDAADGYWAGHIVAGSGHSYDPTAYLDPLRAGFAAASAGAIIPVNAIPGTNRLEVLWFRRNRAEASLGFAPTYWPTVVGLYTLQWPGDAPEIVLASNAGSGPLDSAQAQGQVYYQNDPAQPGYNPNEEHALMLGGQIYALRDDLNQVAPPAYSSEPFVLLRYTEPDGRPAMRAFKVRREAPERGIVFDYIAEAGHILQAPMPLPLLALPVAGSGALQASFNTATGNDPPRGWIEGSDANGPAGHYRRFTFEDRKNNIWVYRGLHQEPALAAGAYEPATETFHSSLTATAVLGQPFTFVLHTSQRSSALQWSASTPLPSWLGLITTVVYTNDFGARTTNGHALALAGTPPDETPLGTSDLTLVVSNRVSGATVTNALALTVMAGGPVVTQGPLALTSTNRFARAHVTYVDRPPFLAQSPGESNSFTMRFYYPTQPGFAWPGRTHPPAVGAIVPYLRPTAEDGSYLGEGSAPTDASLDIVYRPVWPDRDPVDPTKPLPRLDLGATATGPANGRPAIRGQSSLRILYQQSIATAAAGTFSANLTSQASVVLYDPTAAKTLAPVTLPSGVRRESYQGRLYFPALPPHLAGRLFLTADGILTLEGRFQDEPAGSPYLQLNVLRGPDLAAVYGLCPTNDPGYATWTNAVSRLSATQLTYRETPPGSGQFAPDPAASLTLDAAQVIEVSSDNTAVDSYALSAVGPGTGYVTLVAGNGRAFTAADEPVTLYVIRVGPRFESGQLKVLPAENPLSELVSFQHTPDLAGRGGDYEYQWMIAPPVQGSPLAVTNETDGTAGMLTLGWQPLAGGTNLPTFVLGGSGVQVLSDNYLTLRYRPLQPSHPRFQEWSGWTTPALAEGWIKRVLAGINPFNQRTRDLFSQAVNTDANILTQAGHRWEGEVALNGTTINDYGLIEIYETLLRRGQSLSVNAAPPINYGPANDALLLAAGYLSDLYLLLGDEARADAANPTIGIGTKDRTYGDIATALFAFKGQVPSLLEEELALLRGRDDVRQPSVSTPPYYNRMVWNYTRGINAGEVIYALNYNILDQDADGVVDAADAARLFPQGHGDAYGHYLTALTGFYTLLVNPNFDWVPSTEAVNVLGVPVQVGYQHERKFAAAAAAVARTGQQAAALTWRLDFEGQPAGGWEHLSRTNAQAPSGRTKFWGVDHWAVRTGQGAYLHWLVGNAILPAVDQDPSHTGIQKIDRTTVLELQELVSAAEDLQSTLDQAEARATPVGLSLTAVPFDLNPNDVVGGEHGTHFEQIFQRAKSALHNAVAAFDDAKDVTRLMRSEQDSLSDFADAVARQELAYTNLLVEIYGRPYPDDVGPGKTYVQGYAGPDLVHYAYLDAPDLSATARGAGVSWLAHDQPRDFAVSLQRFPGWWTHSNSGSINDILAGTNRAEILFHYEGNQLAKPSTWKSARPVPGKLQVAGAEIMRRQQELLEAIAASQRAKTELDASLVNALHRIWAASSRLARLAAINDALVAIKISEYVYRVVHLATEAAKGFATSTYFTAMTGIPANAIFGTATGGDVFGPGPRVAATTTYGTWLFVANSIDRAAQLQAMTVRFSEEAIIKQLEQSQSAADASQEMNEAVYGVQSYISSLQRSLDGINARLRDLDEAKRNFQALHASGESLQLEREAFRQRAASVIQGFRTRDTAFRLFRNEKLERYQVLFDLAARYAFMAAQAYDYETGLLGTPQGRRFINRIVQARALGVVRNGEPQFAGSNTGDPGLSSTLAEMFADWQVVKGRLGFNNPDAYGTTVSMRTENYRILPGTDGDPNWTDVLQRGRLDDILTDADVRRFCLQIDQGDGLPVPGIVLTFGTTVAGGLNLFGQPLAAGDHAYSASSFATKVFAAGVALEGYRGMDDPSANGSGVGGAGGTSPPDPDGSFLDPLALAATPYVYLIPVGTDSMRTPPLGDATGVRTWTIDDVSVPMPFNIGASDFSSLQPWPSGLSLSEPLFNLRKHQAFRPVSSASRFNYNIYTVAGGLQRSPYTSNRLIGRSVWNSQWKLVIPGHTLLHDPQEGLERFIATVKDIKLNFVTYSYSGN